MSNSMFESDILMQDINETSLELSVRQPIYRYIANDGSEKSYPARKVTGTLDRFISLEDKYFYSNCISEDHS